VNRGILDSLGTLIKQAATAAHAIAAEAGVTPPDLMAMFKLEDSLPMKELAQRIGCDASFVTTIADNLERRGFLRREPGVRDRRVKHLVLTEAGTAAKERMLAQLAQHMPWCYALSDEERRCFLGLLEKMRAAQRPDQDPTM
jgi:DNA-binding MarR family transcriptional regulator